MILRIILCIALLFAMEAHARECLSKNEIKKAVEQSFYSLYRWQSYWYGYYYDIDLESRIRRNGRMIVDFYKEDFLHGFCNHEGKNDQFIQFTAYLKGVDLIYTGEMLDGKANMLATFGDASEKAGEAWHDFNRENGYRLNIKLHARLIKSTFPIIVPEEKLYKYIQKSVLLSEYRHLFRNGIVVGTPRKNDTALLIASRDFENLFLLDFLPFDAKRRGQHGRIASWYIYVYTENLSNDAEKEEKIDKIEKHVKNRLRNDHFVIDCDEC